MTPATASRWWSQLPDKPITDAGYCSTDNIENCEQRTLDDHVAQLPSGARPTAIEGARTKTSGCLRADGPEDPLESPPSSGERCPAQAEAISAGEQTILKPILGRTKGARGLDRFQLRGMEKVSGEWHLIATTYNILKMFRAELAAF